MNEKYSYKDFTHMSFTNTDPSDWNDTEVIGSCFAQSKPKTEIFPVGMTRVTFTKCNLDNVEVPETCTIKGGCHRWIGVQNDLEDWILDDNLNPIEPMDKTRFVKLGLNTSPLSISATKLSKPVTQTKYEQLNSELEAAKKALDDAAIWK